MKIIKSVWLVAIFAAAFVINASAYQLNLINGPAYTNATVILVTGTNGAGGYTYSTNQVGVVATTATNYYNPPTIASYSTTSVAASQANPTNWPSLGFSLTGYPGTAYGPANNLGLETLVYLTATNSSSTLITIHYGASDGFINWSNYFVQTLTIPANTLYVQAWTNITTGALPFMYVQQVDNPGATGAITNLLIDAVTKPGL